MPAARAVEIGELPAALLSPAWEQAVVDVTQPQSLVGAFDIVPGSSFTLCASIQSQPCETTSFRILQKGTPPSGWLFAAPSAATGCIAFAAGARSAVETQPQVPTSTAEDEEGPPPRGEADVGHTRVDDGQWHHVAVVFTVASFQHSNGKLCAYVDGRPDGEVELEIMSPLGAAMHVGPASENDAEVGVAEGSSLKDLQFFPEALSSVQIADLVAKTRVLPTGIPLVLLPKQVSEYWKLQEETGTEVSAKELFAQALDLYKVPRREFQDEVTCALFVDLLAYARSICMTPRKAAVIISIMHVILEAMKRRSETTTCIGEPYSLSECFLEYKRLLVAHTFAAATSGQGSEKRLGIFSLAEVRQLTDFVSSTLFQHYSLYQNVLVCLQESVTKHTEVVLDHPLPPPDLQRAKLRTKLPVTGVAGSAQAYVKAPVTADASTKDTNGAIASSAQAGDVSAPVNQSSGALGYQEGVETMGANRAASKDKPLTIDEHIAKVNAMAEAELQSSIDKRDQALN